MLGNLVIPVLFVTFGVTMLVSAIFFDHAFLRLLGRMQRDWPWILPHHKTGYDAAMARFEQAKQEGREFEVKSGDDEFYLWYRTKCGYWFIVLFGSFFTTLGSIFIAAVILTSD